jgi:hypothetical protein
VVIVLFVGGCKKKEPPSAIVEKVKAAGAGDVETASVAAIEQWFKKHQAVALEVKAMCLRAKERASADWGDTTEGRVCQAAANATVFHFNPGDVKPDNQKF